MSAARLGLLGRRWGQGQPTFVVLHGLGVASRMVAPTCRLLAAHGTVLAPDLPGFGAAASQERGSLADDGAMLSDRMTGLDGPVVLVGCSLGTQVAVHAAARMGDRLDALVLASPTMDEHRRSLPAQLLRWPLELATVPGWLAAVQTEDHGAAGPRRLLATVRDAVSERPEDTARQVTAPTLVVRGTRDPLVSTAWATTLTAAFPDGELQVVPARHAMAATEPGLLADLVVEHLSRRGGPSAPRLLGR